MSEKKEFNFGSSKVAKSYDNMLVPILFIPWANRLIKEFGPWDNKNVLDLATGTGVVAERLSKQVGKNGKVYAVDINPEMLELAKKRCESSNPPVEFIECSAQKIEVSDNSIDTVLCQQGFQFFPDRNCCAREIFRVLKNGGITAVTTWCSVVECQFFGAVCDALEAIGESEISETMSVPFDFMSAEELPTHFESAGFSNVKLIRQEMDLIIDGGIDQAVNIAYATPIGPKLVELSEERQADFKSAFIKIINKLSPDRKNMGRMVTNLLTAEKPV